MRWKEALGLLWLVPAVAAAAMWVRSFWRLDEVAGVNADNVLRAAVSYRGAVHLVRAEHNGTPRGIGWDVYDVPAAADWGDFYALTDLDWRVWGVAKFSTRRGPGTPVNVVAPMRRRPPLTPWIFTPPYAAYAVPYWVLLLITGVVGWKAAARVVRRTWRRRRGLCPGCGYDVRFASERCPECGESLPACDAPPHDEPR
jgi:hypothetical protein